MSCFETLSESTLSNYASVPLESAAPLSSPQSSQHRSCLVGAAAGEDRMSFQVQTLAKMEVVGACRRGRPRGRRNRTAAQKISEVDQRRNSKNTRERKRVENINTLFISLQKQLGLSQLKSDSKACKRYRKLLTLRTAIERIRSLTAKLNLTSGDVRYSIESPQPYQREIDERSVEQGKTSPQAVVVS